MLVIFFQTLDNSQPKWQLGGSRIGTSPALGFRPMPPEKNVEATLIWFKAGDSTNWQHWVDELNKFLEKYRYKGLESGTGEHYDQCDFNNPPKKDDEEGPDKVCEFNYADLGEYCLGANNYGYDVGKPCVIIKLNKIYGWEPDYYKNSSEVPSDMPEQLVEEIKRVESEKGPEWLNMVWLSCEGEGPADKENLGKVTYTPHQGFPGYYFPYKNTPGYLSPLVAVQFTELQSGVLVNVLCKAWSHNVNHEIGDRLGLVHFEILKD